MQPVALQQMIGLDMKKFIVTQQDKDEEALGFYDSDVEGEAAYQEVKAFVEGTFAKYNNVSVIIPTIASSNTKTSIGQISHSTAL